MPEPNTLTPPPLNFGQGVRNIPQPVDPFDSAQKNPGVLPETTVIKQPPAVVQAAPISSSVTTTLLEPEVTAATTPDQPLKIQPTVPPPPRPPLPTKFDAPYLIPKRANYLVYILLGLGVFALIAFLIFGVYYFLFKPSDDNLNTEPVLKLEPQNVPAEPRPFAPPESTAAAKKKVSAENGFGVLPMVSLEEFLIKDLNFKDVVVANESTASALPEKFKVYAFSGEPNLASSSAIYSPEHPGIFKSVTQLNPDQFDAQMSEQSLYPIISPAQALSNLASATKLYGAAERKVDWAKNKLKSFETTNYYLIYYFPPKAKYWYPVYVFEGEGKILGADPKTAPIKFKFLAPAIAQ